MTKQSKYEKNYKKRLKAEDTEIFRVCAPTRDKQKVKDYAARLLKYWRRELNAEDIGL